MDQSLSKSKKRKNDVMYTPVDLAVQAIATIPIEPNDILYDPWRGGGVFYENFPEENNKFYSEISEGLDFFECDKQCDWIISNPPWSCLTKVLEKCATVCRKGFGIIILSTALSTRRITLMKEMGFVLTKIAVCEVKDWFGFNCLWVVFEKTDRATPVLSFSGRF